MSAAIESAVLDYLSSLGMSPDRESGERVTCQFESGWSLHLEPHGEVLRVLILVPREWDLDACLERALRRVNLISGPRFSPMAGLYRDQLLLSLSIDQSRCTRAEITEAVTFLLRLGEACTQ